MTSYSEIVKTIFDRYNDNKSYKINTSEYNKQEINIIVSIILNDHISQYKKYKKNISYKDKNIYGIAYYVYELLQICDKEDCNNLLNNTNYLSLLSCINNGGIILYKLKDVINISKTKN